MIIEGSIWAKLGQHLCHGVFAEHFAYQSDRNKAHYPIPHIPTPTINGTKN
jgi:hypothetical protein